MKALTILQPWAEMIARGVKLVENRIWQTKYRGPLAIHVGKSRKRLDEENPAAWPVQYGVELPRESELVFGAFVAVGELVDCVPIADVEDHFAPWANGPVCWILDNVRRIEPIYCPGAQQIWTPPRKIMPKLLAV